MQLQSIVSMQDNLIQYFKLTFKHLSFDYFFFFLYLKYAASRGLSRLSGFKGGVVSVRERRGVLSGRARARQGLP